MLFSIRYPIRYRWIGFYLVALSVLIIGLSAQANPLTSAKALAHELDYESCRSYEFNFTFFKIYDIYLCHNASSSLADTGSVYDQAFSIVIQYARNFSKDSLSETSIEEMSRYHELSDDQIKRYEPLLLSLFPDVKKGDTIEARYQPQTPLQIKHNQELVGNTNDTEFIIQFLDIWLHSPNHYQEMNDALLK